MGGQCRRRYAEGTKYSRDDRHRDRRSLDNRSFPPERCHFANMNDRVFSSLQTDPAPWRRQTRQEQDQDHTPECRQEPTEASRTTTLPGGGHSSGASLDRVLAKRVSNLFTGVNGRANVYLGLVRDQTGMSLDTKSVIHRQVLTSQRSTRSLPSRPRSVLLA